MTLSSLLRGSNDLLPVVLNETPSAFSLPSDFGPTELVVSPPSDCPLPPPVDHAQRHRVEPPRPASTRPAAPTPRQARRAVALASGCDPQGSHGPIAAAPGEIAFPKLPSSAGR